MTIGKKILFLYNVVYLACFVAFIMTAHWFLAAFSGAVWFAGHSIKKWFYTYDNPTPPKIDENQ